MTTLPQRAGVAALLVFLAGCRVDPKSIEIQLAPTAEEPKPQAKDKADEPTHHFTKAIVRRLQRDENDEIVSKTLTLDDAEEIAKLVKFFPETGKETPSEFGIAGGWTADVFIELTDADGKVHKLATCYEKWNEDNEQGDHMVKDQEGLRKHIAELFKDK